MSSYKSFKKKRANLYSNIKDNLKQEKNPNNDDRFWNLTRDDKDKGQAIIRFIPSVDEEFFVQVFNHGFQDSLTKKYFIEECPTTIGAQCPVCDANKELWAEDPDRVRKQKRHRRFISNIYVVNDEAKPENNGKVFLFKYGPKIFEHIQKAMEPEFEGDESFIPFDFEEGKDFRLRAQRKDMFVNYDSSAFVEDNEFESYSDDELEEIFQKTYPLGDFTDEKKFKSYEELEKSYLFATTKNPPKATTTAVEEDYEDDVEEDHEEIVVAPEPKPASKKKAAKPKAKAKPAATESDDEENDDEFLKQLQQLADDDE